MPPIRARFEPTGLSESAALNTPNDKGGSGAVCTCWKRLRSVVLPVLASFTPEDLTSASRPVRRLTCRANSLAVVRDTPSVPTRLPFDVVGAAVAYANAGARFVYAMR